MCHKINCNVRFDVKHNKFEYVVYLLCSDWQLSSIYTLEETHRKSAAYRGRRIVFDTAGGMLQVGYRRREWGFMPR